MHFIGEDYKLQAMWYLESFSFKQDGILAIRS